MYYQSSYRGLYTYIKAEMYNLRPIFLSSRVADTINCYAGELLKFMVNISCALVLGTFVREQHHATLLR